MMSTRPKLAAPLPKGPRGRTNEVDTQQLLRQVALELFTEFSFHGVSLRQLAAAMQMQVGSLYHHIENKQALLFEMIEEHESDLLELLQTEVPTQANGVEQLESYVRMRLQFNCLHDQRHTLSRLEFRCLSREQQSEIEHIRLLQTQHLASILRHCDLPASECNLIALSMHILLDGVVAGYPNGGRPPLENLAALFSRMVLNGLCRRQAKKASAQLIISNIQKACK
ncbi:transcriptional regulator, TetR family [Pseudomonas marincola]|nr:transcriptional regulator, TetR family [Pseudomonas marincola]